MTQYILDLNGPKFQKMLKALSEGHPDALDALSRVKSRIESNVEACHRCIQPVGEKYPHLHSRIWKYDWAPPSVRGSSRKSWRLIVYLADKESFPRRLVAIACYSKASDNQLDLKTIAQYVAEAKE